MNEKISILGTGWLGLPLAKTLVSEGYHIKGATTSVDKLELLKNEGIFPYQIKLEEKGPIGDIDSFLEESNILIINIPPGLRRNPGGNFVAKIQNLIPYIENSDIQKALFISSTSVFKDTEEFPIITSKSIPNATSNAGKQLIEVEKSLQNNPHFETTILRFGGLFDQRRHPATMLSKRSGIKNPKAPVNLIHLDDCIGIIQKIIETERWNTLFNAAYPNHPEKAEYYSKICEQMGLSKPDYDFDIPSKGKVIDSSRIVEELDFRFTVDLITY